MCQKTGCKTCTCLLYQVSSFHIYERTKMKWQYESKLCVGTKTEHRFYTTLNATQLHCYVTTIIKRTPDKLLPTVHSCHAYRLCGLQSFHKRTKTFCDNKLSPQLNTPFTHIYYGKIRNTRSHGNV